MNYSKTLLAGNLTTAPEVKYTPSGMAYTEFNIAVNRKYKDKKETDFFKCKAWGKTAEALCNYTDKGQNLFLECEPRQETWTDKNSGKEVRKTVFSILSFEFTTKKHASTQNDNQLPVIQNDPGPVSKPEVQQQVQTDGLSFDDDNGDDIPF